MKKAEEIIYGFGYYPSKEGTEQGRLIVEAMEEYAKQFKIQSDAIKLKEELLIVFCQLAKNSYKMVNDVTSEESVLRILQSRGSELYKRFSSPIEAKQEPTIYINDNTIFASKPVVVKTDTEGYVAGGNVSLISKVEVKEKYCECTTKTDIIIVNGKHICSTCNKPLF